MNKNDILKNFALGFIPLFVFIIADELFGTETGLIVAVAVGVVQLVYYIIRYRRLEKFIFFDTGLIILLGSISILLHDEIFFKLKPALIELILVALVGVHAFSSKPVLLLMGKRYLGDMKILPEQEEMMRRLSKVLFFIFLIHTILIVYSAYFWSKEVWAFISGGLFYILFGIILAGQWVMNTVKLQARLRAAQCMAIQNFCILRCICIFLIKTGNYIYKKDLKIKTYIPVIGIRQLAGMFLPGRQSKPP
jgi:intracellular septation protein A